MSRIREVFTAYTVLQDSDGVCILSEIPVLEAMNARLNSSYRPKDITGWNWVYEEALVVKKDEAIAQELRNNWFNSEVLIKAPPDKGVRFVSLVFAIGLASIYLLLPLGHQIVSRRQLPGLDAIFLGLQGHKFTSGGILRKMKINLR